MPGSTSVRARPSFKTVGKRTVDLIGHTSTGRWVGVGKSSGVSAQFSEDATVSRHFRLSGVNWESGSFLTGRSGRVRNRPQITRFPTDERGAVVWPQTDVMVEDISSAALVGRGATIGRYLVLDMIGKGGMGEVYAAYDPELDRKVAIKVLRTSSSAAADPVEGRARILREAQALAQLSDPNVVAVYDVGTFGERVFLAMEFVDGTTLNYWQQSHIRSWHAVIEMYTEAGRGLAAAHRRGLVHRDFKPENAMVGRDGHVRVMDFGLARSDAQPAMTG